MGKLATCSVEGRGPFEIIVRFIIDNLIITTQQSLESKDTNTPHLHALSTFHHAHPNLDHPTTPKRDGGYVFIVLVLCPIS